MVDLLHRRMVIALNPGNSLHCTMCNGLSSVQQKAPLSSYLVMSVMSVFSYSLNLLSSGVFLFVVSCLWFLLNDAHLEEFFFRWYFSRSIDDDPNKRQLAHFRIQIGRFEKGRSLKYNSDGFINTKFEEPQLGAKSTVLTHETGWIIGSAEKYLK